MVTYWMAVLAVLKEELIFHTIFSVERVLLQLFAMCSPARKRVLCVILGINKLTTVFA